MRNLSEDFDWQAAQYQDELVRQQVLLEQLDELHRLVDACSNYTWLKEDDVRTIAAGCGLYDEYLQVIKSKQEAGNEQN